MNQPCNYTTTGGCPEPQAAQGCAACSGGSQQTCPPPCPPPTSTPSTAAASPAAVSRAGAVPAVSAPVPAGLAG